MLDWMEDFYDGFLGFFSENPYVIIVAICAALVMNVIIWKSPMWNEMDMKTKVLIAVFSGPLSGGIAYAMRSR